MNDAGLPSLPCVPQTLQLSVLLLSEVFSALASGHSATAQTASKKTPTGRTDPLQQHCLHAAVSHRAETDTLNTCIRTSA